MFLEGIRLQIFLYGSMLFCWGALWMAKQDRRPAAPQVNKPRTQAVIATVVFAAILLISVAARVFRPALDQFAPDFIDLIFSGLIVVAVTAAAAAMRDAPGSVGLSPRGIETVVIFITPVMALVFLPGHAMNLKILLPGITPSIIVAGFAVELLFRGYLQTRLEAAMGPRKGLLLTAAAYTVFQLPMIWKLLYPPEFAVFAILTFLVWGCAAGLMYRLAGNIFGLAVFHIFWDISVRVFGGFVIE